MAQRTKHNVEQEALVAIRRGLSTEVEDAPRTTAMFLGARDLQFPNSTFSVVGGDLVSNYSQHFHHHYDRPKDIWAVLQSIPNFRRIYQDMLSKATRGTGVWLLKGDKFRLWLEPNGDIKIFWGSGIPGAGKTLLATIVIEHLEALCKESGSTVCICYVYFRYSERAEVTIRNVLETLVKQTLERHPECLELVQLTYVQHLQEGTEPNESQLLALLRELAGRMMCTFYILDALDEAPKKIQLTLVKALSSLNVKLFVTSRPLEDVEEHFPEAYILPITAKDNDIELHITKVISESASLQKLFRRAEPSLREETIATIKRNCGGMFLHASLQLEALSECVSAREARDTLQAFPPRIEDVYRQTWARISNQGGSHPSLAKAFLLWVINASRSMTMEELECALATCPTTYKFEPDRRVSGSTLMSLCHGMVIVEEETRLVRLVHYTAKETLEKLLSQSFPHPHSLLAAVCITHLTGCNFQKTTVSTDEEFRAALRMDPLLAYASEAWAFHARAALDLEDTKRRTRQFIGGITAFPAFGSPDHSQYFDILTPLHVVGLYKLPPALLEDTVMSNPNVTTALGQASALVVASQSGHEDLVAHLIAIFEIKVNLFSRNRWSALNMAARYGHEGIVKLLLERPEILVNQVNRDGWSSLMLAVRHGHEGIVKLLLASPEILVNQVNRDEWSALMLAACYGHDHIVRLLLEHPKIRVNQVNKDEWSALFLAARNGHDFIVRLLLERPEIQVTLVNKDGWSALIVAARYVHIGVVKLLLERPEIQVNLVNKGRWSALMLAARDGHEAIVKLLLERPDIQVNLLKDDVYSALASAAFAGHEGVVKLLLAKPDIQVNLFKDDGWTALMLAARHGHEVIAKLLLEHPEIQVNLVNKDGWPALFLAARHGHEGVVNLLLERPEIQINLANKDGWSALILAARYGQEGIVKLILAHPKIQINLVSNNRWSALMHAARHGHEGMVKLLLAHPKIQINLVNSDGCSALILAANQGHEYVVKLLLAHPKIQVNLANDNGWSALILAATQGHGCVTKVLLAHPCIQVNLANNHGSTALQMAAHYGHKPVVELLVATANLSVNAFNNDGDTAIKMAAQKGHEAIVHLLLDVPGINTMIRSTADGHTAMSVAQANGHGDVVHLLQDFESRKDIAATSLDISQPSVYDSPDEDGSDSDSLEFYFDAEGQLTEDAIEASDAAVISIRRS